MRGWFKLVGVFSKKVSLRRDDTYTFYAIQKTEDFKRMPSLLFLRQKKGEGMGALVRRSTLGIKAVFFSKIEREWRAKGVRAGWFRVFQGSELSFSLLLLFIFLCFCLCLGSQLLWACAFPDINTLEMLVF